MMATSGISDCATIKPNAASAPGRANTEVLEPRADRQDENESSRYSGRGGRSRHGRRGVRRTIDSWVASHLEDGMDLTGRSASRQVSSARDGETRPGVAGASGTWVHFPFAHGDGCSRGVAGP